VLHVGFGRHYPEEPGIACRPVIFEPLYVAMLRTRSLDWRSPAAVVDLPRPTAASVYPATRPEFADEVIDMCMHAGFTPRVAVEAEDVVSCLAYVALGTAIAVVPESATKTVPDVSCSSRSATPPPAPLYCAHL